MQISRLMALLSTFDYYIIIWGLKQCNITYEVRDKGNKNSDRKNIQ